MKNKIFSRRAILICLMLLAFLAACRTNATYREIFSEPLDIVRFDEKSNSLWMAEFVGEEILSIRLGEGSSIRNRDSAILVNVPGNLVVTTLCISSEAWAEFLDPSSKEFSIYKYDASNGTWQKHSNFASASAKCKVFNNGDIVFWSTNKLLLATTSAETIIIGAPEDLWDVSLDTVGNYWLATENGNIYHYNNNSGWDQRYATIENPYIFFDAENYLWVVNHENVFRFNTNNDNGEAQKIIETDLGFTQSIFQDNQERIWIIGTTRIIVWNNGEVTEIRPPHGASFLRYGDYDPSENKIFLSTNIGIFYIQLDGSAE